MFSIFSKFKNGLQKTAVAVNRKIAGLFTGNKEWTEEDFAELERTLIGTDLGMSASRTIVQNIRERYKLGELKSSDDISRVAAAELKKILSEGARPMRKNPDGVTVLLFVGVNGSGKTTTIGKLAAALTQDGSRVMLGACDTFRAAAVEQLTLWAERTGSQIVAAKQGADPASVAFDAVKSAAADLASKWEGDGQKAFVANQDEAYRWYSSIHAVVKYVIETVKKVIDTYREAEKRAASIMRG